MASPNPEPGGGDPDPTGPSAIDDLLADGGLMVDYCGEIHLLAAGKTLTFGRQAELEIDDNDFLHRQLGRFECHDGRWWLANIGSHIELDIFDRTTRASARLTPGTTLMLPGTDLILKFVAGPTTYELLLRCAAPTTVETSTPTDTVNLASMAWAPEQRLLMAILAESLLRFPHAPLRLPTNAEARARLGWSEAKFNRKLDNVCDRLSSSGVRGLEKGVDKRNNERRRILAETAVNRGLVTSDDLGPLEHHERAARQAAPS